MNDETDSQECLRLMTQATSAPGCALVLINLIHLANIAGYFAGNATSWFSNKC